MSSYPLGRPQALSPQCSAWPAPFCDLADPPPGIEFCGALPAWSQTVAIVGTRRPSPEAAHFARELAHTLAREGRVIVSGGAQGIDAEAHRGALEAGGVTIAVLGVPLDRPYPMANLPLFRAITERGAVLSEYPAEALVYPARFLERNRLIAALARAVVVVEAPARSGALSTAREARKLERPLFAVPSAPWHIRGEGTLALLAAGALVCRSSRDVLSLAAASPERTLAKTHRKKPRRPDKAKESHRLDEDEQAVVAALREGFRSADELCEATELTAPRVQRAILMLLLSKVICEVGSGRYGRHDYR
jgi:DNA processing protein